MLWLSKLGHAWSWFQLLVLTVLRNVISPRLSFLIRYAFLESNVLSFLKRFCYCCFLFIYHISILGPYWGIILRRYFLLQTSSIKLTEMPISFQGQNKCKLVMLLNASNYHFPFLTNAMCKVMHERVLEMFLNCFFMFKHLRKILSAYFDAEKILYLWVMYHLSVRGYASIDNQL